MVVQRILVACCNPGSNLGRSPSCFECCEQYCVYIPQVLWFLRILAGEIGGLCIGMKDCQSPLISWLSQKIVVSLNDAQTARGLEGRRDPSQSDGECPLCIFMPPSGKVLQGVELS